MAYHYRLQRIGGRALGSLRGAAQGELALTANTSVGVADGPVLWVTPDADGWTLTLPAQPTKGFYIIINLSGAYTFNVLQSDGATVAAVMAPYAQKQFTYRDSDGLYY